MSYASVYDLKAVIRPEDLALLTDWTGAADTPDDTRLQAALDDASAEVDGYIAKRVSLPLADPPRMLLVVCRDLAVHRLYANAGRTTDTQDRLRDSALAWLRSVSRGEAAIGDETPGNEEATSPGVVVDAGPDRVMTRDGLKGF